MKQNLILKDKINGTQETDPKETLFINYNIGFSNVRGIKVTCSGFLMKLLQFSFF